MTPLATLTAGSAPGAARFTVRQATAADVAALVALLTDDDLGRTREDPSGDGLAVYQRAFAAIEANPDQLLVVVTPAAEPVTVAATLQLTFIPGLSRQGALRAQLEAVRVASPYRSRGLGEAMIGWAVAEARRRGAALVQLTSDKRRSGALRFYARLGFTASHEGFKLTL